MAPPRQLTEGYKLTLEERSNINLDMQDLYRALGVIAAEVGVSNRKEERKERIKRKKKEENNK